MKRLIFFIPIFLIIKANGQTPINDPHWILIWEDQFNSFDDTKWRKTNNCDHGGEPQLYLEQNVSTANGNLILTLKREDYSCPPNAPVNVWECGSCVTGTKKYTSGMVISQVSDQVKYGYIEAKIKLPYGAGYWPAFWTWVGTPDYQEIDIFEMIPGTTDACVISGTTNLYHNKNVTTSNMHYCGGCLPGTFFCISKYKTSYINDYTQWHKYAIEWSPSKIIWYIDDYPYRVEVNDNKFDFTNIIFNFALNNHDAAFPSNFNYGGLTYGQSAEMLVDYVKYFKLNNSCNETPPSCSYNFGNHTNTVKQSIVLGNNSCSISVPSNQPYFFRASEGILINGDFTVPIGSEIYLDVNPCYE